MNYLNHTNSQPTGSKIILNKTEDLIIVDIPPAGFFSSTESNITYIWVYILIVTIGATIVALQMDPEFLFISFPAWFTLAIISVVWFQESNSSFLLKIDRENFCLQRKCGNFRQTVEGKTANLNRLEVNYRYIGKSPRPQITCALIEGVRTHRFAPMLTQIEKEWLVAEVNDFLAKLNR